MIRSERRESAGGEKQTGLTVGDEVEIDVTDLLSNGQGVGRASGVVVFAWGALPGERARIRITLVKAKYAVGELMELRAPSPERRVPFCELFGECGGCQVQHLAYPAQLIWKRRLVSDALTRIGGLTEVSVEPVVGMVHPRAYRNKAALVVRDGTDGAEFGFYQARSHDLVNVAHCPVAAPLLDQTIANLWTAARDPVAGEAFRDARHAVVRVSEAAERGVLSLTTERRSPAVARAAVALERALPGIAGISNSFDPAGANAVMGRRSATIAGTAQIEERIDGIRFAVSAPSFFQVNPAMVKAIFEHMRPMLEGVGRVLDLYCGAGTFSLVFARAGATVLGIEENPDAVREARANADANGVTAKTTFLAGRVERMLAAGPASDALARAEVVFLDPPRKGSDEATLAAIGAARVPQIWYLSCNPATLARDLASLVRSGYALARIQPFDMFPQTGHVETLAVLKVAGGEREPGEAR